MHTGFGYSPGARPRSTTKTALSAAESSGSLSVRDLADIHYWAGLAHYHDQDVGPCVHHYERAIAAYRLAGDVRGLAQALLEKARTGYTLAALPLGALADVKHLEDVLTSLGDEEPELRGHVAAVMAEVYRNGRHAEESRKWARHALDLGRQIADDHLCAHASYSLGQAYIHELEAAEAVAAWEGAVVHARRAGDVIREGWALHRIPLALTLLGRLNEAAAVALTACEVTRKSQDWSNHSVGLSHLSSVAAAQGNFDLAERRAHESMLMVSRSRYPWGGFRALLALACARAVRGAGPRRTTRWTSSSSRGRSSPIPGRSSGRSRGSSGGSGARMRVPAKRRSRCPPRCWA